MKRSQNGVQKIVPMALIALSAFVPTLGQASNLIGTYSTGTHFDSGGCFSMWFNRNIGTGYKAANVQLAGHEMSYASSDHHIRKSGMTIQYVSYNRSTGNVSFNVYGCFYDKNFDDDLYWNATYTIVGDEW